MDLLESKLIVTLGPEVRHCMKLSLSNYYSTGLRAQTLPDNFKLPVRINSKCGHAKHRGELFDNHHIIQIQQCKLKSVARLLPDLDLSTPRKNFMTGIINRFSLFGLLCSRFAALYLSDPVPFVPESLTLTSAEFPKF